jgi:CRISPR/Cas system-associated exonuclease Cas4 (RecB family)
MDYTEEDLIPLSALQHLAFCERQCALIHIEQMWDENRLTAEGKIMHERVHDLIRSGHTPKPVYTKKCKNCSLFSHCLPEVFQKERSVKRYLAQAVKEE